MHVLSFARYFTGKHCGVEAVRYCYAVQLHRVSNTEGGGASSRSHQLCPRRRARIRRRDHRVATSRRHQLHRQRRVRNRHFYTVPHSMFPKPSASSLFAHICLDRFLREQNHVLCKLRSYP